MEILKGVAMNDMAQDFSRTFDAIEHVDLRVRDIDDALGFYSGVAGLEVGEKTTDTATLRDPGGDPIVMLTSEGVTRPAERRAAGLFHTAIRFPTRASLGEALGRLASAGYQIGAGDHGVSEALYIDDPDGNGVELYWDRPRDQWPVPKAGERVGMYTAPVDLQDLLAAGDVDGAIPTAAPSGTDIGHVHLQAKDIDETTEFYRDVLGLDLMAKFGGQASFLSSQGYHHHIGANVWNSLGQGPAGPDHAGLARIVFRVSKLDELDKLRDRLSVAGREPRSENGTVTVQDPNGVELVFRPAA